MPNMDETPDPAVDVADRTEPAQPNCGRTRGQIRPKKKDPGPARVRSGDGDSSSHTYQIRLRLSPVCAVA